MQKLTEKAENMLQAILKMHTTRGEAAVANEPMRKTHLWKVLDSGAIRMKSLKETVLQACWTSQIAVNGWTLNPNARGNTQSGAKVSIA